MNTTDEMEVIKQKVLEIKHSLQGKGEVRIIICNGYVQKVLSDIKTEEDLSSKKS